MRNLPHSLEVRAFAKALSDLLDAEIEVVFKRFCDRVEPSETSSLHFVMQDESLRASIDLEPQLVDDALCQLLSQGKGIAGERVLSSPAVRGMLSRIVVEAARNMIPALSVRASPGLPDEPAYGALGVVAMVLFNQRPYEVRACFERLRPAQPVPSRRHLGGLGDLRLRVRLLGAICLADRDSLARLELGDAFLPGEAWWLSSLEHGTLAIAAEDSAQGVFFEIVDPRNAKLVGVGDLPNCEDTSMPHEPESDLSESIADAVLDAPVVVRVEVASISMSAAQLAQLRVGDIIETDQQLGEMTTLRVAGREIARGELVNVEGQLGVRIRKIARRDQT
jgi:flagellar motor switch/type III secretory pathway protein FliN